MPHVIEDEGGASNVKVKCCDAASSDVTGRARGTVVRLEASLETAPEAEVEPPDHGAGGGSPTCW